VVGDVAELIAPGEKVLWRGHPTGYPFSCGALLSYAVLLFVCGFPFFFIASDPLSNVLGYKLGIGTLTLTVDGLGAPIRDYTVPNPLGGLVPIILIEIWRITAWQARGFWITDRRVIETDRQGRIADMPLRDIKDVRAWGSDLDITSRRGRTLTLPAIDDIENVRAILFAAIPPSFDAHSAPSP
jgi:hypothetical protein